MDLMNDLQLSTVMHAVTQGVLVPTVIILILLLLYSIYTIGSVVVEYVGERRGYQMNLTALVAAVHDCAFDDLERVIADSKLLLRQKMAIMEVVGYMDLPEAALTEVARRRLADEKDRYLKVLARMEFGSKAAPMFGLMGTLIPLGPGLVSLGNGDTSVLSSALIVAFDTTVIGLIAAVICMGCLSIRRRWYDDYLLALENIMNTLLERSKDMQAAGIDIPRRLVVRGAGAPAAAKAGVRPSEGAVPTAKRNGAM